MSCCVSKLPMSIKACHERINQLEAGLKAIRTWAAYDVQENRVRALLHSDVINACDRALKNDNDVG